MRSDTFACLVGHVVQVAVRIRLLQVHGRQGRVVLHREQRQDTFKCASRSKKMAVHRLGGTDGNVFGTMPEYRAYRRRFGPVIGLRAGTMGVYRMNVLWRHARSQQRRAQPPGGEVTKNYRFEGEGGAA